MKPPSVLSERELEVLKLLGLDFCEKQIGVLLHISHKTVEKHTSNIYRKLNIHTRPKIVHYCLHHELIRNLFDPLVTSGKSPSAKPTK
jgi:two-component system response regulator NreC